MSDRTRYGSTGRWSWYDNAYRIMLMYVTVIAVVDDDDIISYDCTKDLSILKMIIRSNERRQLLSFDRVTTREAAQRPRGRGEDVVSFRYYLVSKSVPSGRGRCASVFVIRAGTWWLDLDLRIVWTSIEVA
jgi:hypothetical protein